MNIKSFENFILNEAIVSKDYFKTMDGSIENLEIYENPKWLRNFKDGSKAIVCGKTLNLYIVDSNSIYHVQLIKKLQDLKLINTQFNLTGNVKTDFREIKTNQKELNKILLLTKMDKGKEDFLTLATTYDIEDLNDDIYDIIFSFDDKIKKNKYNYFISGNMYMDEEAKKRHSDLLEPEVQVQKEN